LTFNRLLLEDLLSRFGSAWLVGLGFLELIGRQTSVII